MLHSLLMIGAKFCSILVAGLALTPHSNNPHVHFTNAIIRLNQVTLQHTTDNIPTKILPNLDILHDDFRTFCTSLNAKIEWLQNSVSTQDDQVSSGLASMTNLRECVRAAAEVVSTA
jgi:hypothetical protein